jgi:hypothetical protein
MEAVLRGVVILFVAVHSSCFRSHVIAFTTPTILVKKTGNSPTSPNTNECQNNIINSNHNQRSFSLNLLNKNDRKSFIPELPSNPFENVQSFFGGESSSPGSASGTGGDSNAFPTEFTPTPNGFIFQAKRLVASDFGLLDPTVLDDSQFRWIDANSPTAVALSKTEYVAAGRFFNLRGAFPDIDYRAHDYRYVAPDTVRITRRVQGTMRGELRLRSGTVPPSGLIMKCPPEAVTIVFDADTGKVTKLCTGFVLDRLVGNTAGTAGVVAASIIAGQPAVSDWDLYPLSTIFSRVFARPSKRIEDAESFLAPFPEQVMIQLAKGVLNSNMGADDPSLLSDSDFTFMTPTVGPIRKKEFLDNYALEEFRDISDPQFSAFRVDPYDPVRVWVDLQPMAPGYVGCPQAMSLAFDDDGFCTRITSWAIMDPSVGNAGGLGGPEGYRYATGSPSLGLSSRSLPSLLGRIKKRALSPITGIAVDEYSPISSRTSSSTNFKLPKPPKVTPPPPPPVTSDDVNDDESTARQAAADVVMKRLETLKNIGASIRIVPPSIPSIQINPPTRISQKTSDDEKSAIKKQQEIRDQQAKKAKQQAQQRDAAEQKVKQQQAQLAAQKASSEEIRRKQQQVDARQAQSEAQKAAKVAERDEQKLKQAQADASRKQQIAAQKAAADAEDARRKKQIDAQKAAVAADEARRKKQIEADRATAEAAARRKKAEAQKASVEAERKAKAERDRKAKERLASVKTKVGTDTTDQKVREQAALATLAKAASRATISLFGLGGRQSDDDDDVVPASKVSSSPSRSVQPAAVKKISAPPGVPTLSRWRRNPDNSITGLVKGSKGFTDGSRITTSPIQTGTIAGSEVVKTGSGSRYFLE